MKTLKLDISKAGVEITPRMEERTREALSLLYSKQGAGNDFLGWVTLPSSIAPQELSRIEAEAKKLRECADEETKGRLRRGEVTINKAYNELMQKEHEGETKICERCKQEKSLSAFSIPSNRRSFSSVCRDCEKEISAVAKSAAEAAAKPADTAASSEPPCPIPGMVMHNGAPIHVERPLPDTPEMFRYVADLVKSCCDSYVIGLTSAMRRYSNGMGSEEHNAQILEMVRRTNAQVLTILNERMEEK